MGNRIMALWPYWRPVAWLIAAWMLRPVELWVPMLVWLAAMFTIETVRGDSREIPVFWVVFGCLANISQLWVVAGAMLWLGLNANIGELARHRHEALGYLKRVKFLPALDRSRLDVPTGLSEHTPFSQKWLADWLPLCLWTLPIAYFSGGAGGAGSWRGWMAQFHLTPEQVEIILWWVRKAIHFTYYGCMAWLAARAIWRSSTTDGRSRLVFVGSLAAIWVIGHAGFDELRQAVTSGRTGSWSDLGIDLLGAAVFLGLFVTRGLCPVPLAK